jgi:hypothetical protein
MATPASTGREHVTKGHLSVGRFIRRNLQRRRTSYPRHEIVDRIRVPACEAVRDSGPSAGPRRHERRALNDDVGAVKEAEFATGVLLPCGVIARPDRFLIGPIRSRAERVNLAGATGIAAVTVGGSRTTCRHRADHVDR